MEKTKRNVLKIVLIAFYSVILMFLAIFTINPLSASADEAIVPGYEYGGFIYNDGSIPIVELPEDITFDESTKKEVEIGDALGGWYSVEYSDTSISLFNTKATLYYGEDIKAVTVRALKGEIKFSSWLIEYKIVDGQVYFYLPANLEYWYCLDVNPLDPDEDGVINDYQVFPDCVSYENQTITYVYDTVVYHYEAQDVVVEPEEPTNPETPVEPEEPTEPETPVEPEEPTEPEEPGEDWNDKFSKWLEDQAKNWEELSDAGKGLSIGALITLFGAIVIIIKISK